MSVLVLGAWITLVFNPAIPLYPATYPKCTGLPARLIDSKEGVEKYSFYLGLAVVLQRQDRLVDRTGPQDRQRQAVH